MILRPADRAWLALAGGILAYDLACPPGETLSEGMGRYHQARPWATRIGIAVVALHLLDWLPAKLDPFTSITLIRYWT